MLSARPGDSSSSLPPAPGGGGSLSQVYGVWAAQARTAAATPHPRPAPLVEATPQATGRAALSARTKLWKAAVDQAGGADGLLRAPPMQEGSRIDAGLGGVQGGGSLDRHPGGMVGKPASVAPKPPTTEPPAPSSSKAALASGDGEGATPRPSVRTFLVIVGVATAAAIVLAVINPPMAQTPPEHSTDPASGDSSPPTGRRSVHRILAWSAIAASLTAWCIVS